MSYPKGMPDILRENEGLNRKTLLSRAPKIPLIKVAGVWIIRNEKEEDKLINPIYWKVGKRAKKNK